MSITESILGELLGRYYVQQTFSGDSKVRAQELIDRIKEAFAEHLPEVDWYDTGSARFIALHCMNSRLTFKIYSQFAQDGQGDGEGCSAEVGCCGRQDWLPR